MFGINVNYIKWMTQPKALFSVLLYIWSFDFLNVFRKQSRFFKQRSTCRTITGWSPRPIVWVFPLIYRTQWCQLSHIFMWYLWTFCNFAFFFSFIGLLIIKNGPSLQMITQILKNNHPPAIYKYIGGHIFV